MPLGGSRNDGSTGAVSEAQAHDACLRLLAARPRSRHELAQRLVGRGCTDDVAHRVLDRLEGVGLVDDGAFAAAWVHSRHTYSGKGRRALSNELRAKGVDDEHVRSALEQVDDDAERDRAVELVDRKLRGAPVPQDDGARAALTRRLVGMLARRGYPAGMVRDVVTGALSTAGAPTDEPS